MGRVNSAGVGDSEAASNEVVGRRVEKVSLKFQLVHFRREDAVFADRLCWGLFTSQTELEKTYSAITRLSSKS